MQTSRIRGFVEEKFLSLIYLWNLHKGRELRDLPMAERFSRIYHQNMWGDAESRSGFASTLANTQAVREQLPGFIEEVGARSMLDIPCGDFNWMKEVPLDLDRYIGADIVQSLTDSNRRFEDGTRTFATLDITCDALPKVDLVLCRDCLIHFSFDDIARAIENVKASQSAYLLTTTFVNRKRRNIDIITGNWRPLNLQQPPFNFPPPISILNENNQTDGGRYADKCLAMWRIAGL